MNNPGRYPHKNQRGGRHQPSVPMAVSIQQWPPALNETYYYSTSVNPIPVNVLGPVSNTVTPITLDNDSIVVPVVVPRNFCVPPPVFPSKAQYLAQSHEAWAQPSVVEPSTTQHTFSPDAPEFIPSSQKAYKPPEPYQVTSAGNHSAALSASSNHQNVQTQHQYQNNTNKRPQGGYYSHQENQFSSAYSGARSDRHHNTNLGSYEQKRNQENINSEGMIKPKRETNKVPVASKRPPWSEEPQKQTQVKDASEKSSKNSSQFLSCMPSIHSKDEPTLAHAEGSTMIKMNVQDIHKTRLGQSNYPFQVHPENDQNSRYTNSNRGRPFKKFNNNYPHGYHNQGDYYSSYDLDYYSYNTPPKGHYYGYSPRTREFTSRSYWSGMPRHTWVPQPNYTSSAYRGKKFNHQVERETREQYHSEGRRHHNRDSSEFNPGEFEEELHQNNHRQHYPKQHWQHPQGVSQMEAEFYNSRSSGRQPYSGRESQVRDSESLNETSSSNDVEPDEDDINSVDIDYYKGQASAQDAEQYTEPSSDPGLIKIQTESHPELTSVEPSSENIDVVVAKSGISENKGIEVAKSGGPLDKTGETACEPTIIQDHSKAVGSNLLLAEVPDKVDPSFDQAKSSHVDIKKEKDSEIDAKTVMDNVEVLAKVALKKQDSFGQHDDKLKINEAYRNYANSNKIDNSRRVADKKQDNSSQHDDKLKINEAYRNYANSNKIDNSRRVADNNVDGSKQTGKGHDRSWQPREAASESAHKGRPQMHARESWPKPIQRNNVADMNSYRASRQNADRPGFGGRVSVQRPNSELYSSVIKGEKRVYRSSNDRPNIQGESRENLEEKMSKNKLTARQNSVLLDDYNSDLNLIVDAGGYGAFTVDSPLGFSKLWADCKATHGVNKGKSYFEVKLMDLIDTIVPEENDQRPNVLRIGWSAENAVFEANTGSWSFGYKDSSDTVKGDAFCQTTTKDDVLGAMVNFDIDPVEISYLKNGEAIGQTALFTPSSKNTALFPHISLKNCKVRVNFGQRESPWYPPPDGFGFIGKGTISELSHSLSPPVKKSDCELIMMIGLPGSGKTTWATQKQEEHRDRRYNILGTDLLIELMKASKNGLHLSETDEDLYSLAEGCYKRLLTIASMKIRNYILDEVNVQASTRAEKLRKFNPFIRRAVIVQPSMRDLELQREKLSTTGRNVPEFVLKEMQANFTLPERSEEFKFIEFVGLKEQDAKKLIEMYQDGGQSKSPMLALD